jgi:hypothetical protein
MIKSIIFCLFFGPIYSQLPFNNWDDEMVEVVHPDKSGVLMSVQTIFDEKWHELNQPFFWKHIMRLSPDSCLLNVGTSRQILAKFSVKDWSKLSINQKSIIKENLKKEYNLSSDEIIKCTTGKSDFYKFDKVYESLSKGVLAFERFHCDPWYAQAILLIESPGQLLKSSAGAYGPFQLMPSVARAQGIIVSDTLDERSDFDRSAYAASNLINKICIPNAKRIFEKKNIQFKEKDLWFRLFVMHIYHAGTINVQAVFDKINPSEGGQELIKAMWKTEAGKFGNSSQNYSQLVIASQIILNEMVGNDCVRLFSCSGD